MISKLLKGLLVCSIYHAVGSPASAQLNQNCTVSILNRNTQVLPDGTWRIPNVPAGFGLVRARATCVNGGITTSGQSNLFAISPNQVTGFNANFSFGSATSIPTSLTITAPLNTLTSAGQTTQLTVTATYASGPSQNVTSSSAGTTYTTSNPAIAGVSANGLVTALKTGTVIIQATNEGRSAIQMISVVLMGGVDTDGDGIPDDVEIRLHLDPNDPTDALLDFDHDGLTNLDEYRLGTDLHNADTDGDGIPDGDEAHGTGLACNTMGQCYHTSPLLADTDGDGIGDRTEILTGSDPTNPNNYNLHDALRSISVNPSNFTLIVNSLNGTASVQLTVTGTLIDNKTIDLTSTARGTNYFSTNLNACNFGSPDGRVFAGSAGSCMITITNNGFMTTANGAVTNFTPLDLSFVAIPGFANAVAASGDFAFVAAGASGLQVVSLSADRTHPVVAGSLALAGSSYDVNLVGNTAYVAGSSTLSVVDITNPVTPVLRGTFNSGNCLGVVVKGATAYLNCSTGLVLVNVTNPASMIQISTLAVGGTPWKLDVDSTRHFVALAMGSSGLKLVDVTNPAAPVLRGTASTGDARAVALSGTWAYVADYNNSTTSVDTTSLTAPLIRSHIVNQSLGGRLQDIALSSNFALGADVVFVNGVPFTDISEPTNLQARTILNFTQRDDNGMGLAVDSAFVYLVTEHANLNRGGSTGDSRLYIGQFLPRQDLAGVAPTCNITSPAGGATVYQGAQLTVNVAAIDDVAVASVDFLVNGQVVFTSTTSPYQYTFTVPVGINSLTLGAKAHDLGNNVGTAQNVVLNVLPDPLTLVSGLVTDSNSSPVSGATLTTNGGLMSVTGADGRFSIPGVPTVLGNIVVNASYTPSGQPTLTGTSLSIAPVLGGITDVGTIQLVQASFITNYGTLVSRCDDCFYMYNLPFAFPFYGATQTSAYVGTNGYITFGAGDDNYIESLPDFTSLPRISAFFDDLYATSAIDPTAGLYVNTAIPGLFLVTYLNTPHYSSSTGPNTLQIQLYSDGRIIFAYHGITSLNLGSITGLTPGPNLPSQAIDYSQQTNVNIPANTAVYEYFTGASLFDLDNSLIIFTPQGSAYNARTLVQAIPAQLSVLSGSVSRNPASGSAQPISPNYLARAEVIVHSSSNVRYVGMTNTDAQGNFVLTGVPTGGILVEIRRNGTLLAQGSGIFAGGSLNTAQALSILIVAPPTSTKTTPQKN